MSLWLCCTPQNNAKEEVIGDCMDSGDEIKLPKALRVRASRFVVLGGSAPGEPSLRCEVPGKPASRVERPLPFELQVPCFHAGDALRFALLAEGSKAAIGEITLPYSSFHPQGFSGELPLTSGKETSAYVSLSIAAEGGGGYPPEPASAAGYLANVEVGPGSEINLSSDLDLMDRVHAQVLSVQSGPMQAYNETAGVLQKIQADDFIYSVNGCKWSADVVSQVKQGKNVCTIGQRPETRCNFIVKRPVRKTVTVSKRDGTLGLDLWFENDNSPALVVTRVNEGPVSVWNAENPDRPLERLDRIVAVNGSRCNASSLLAIIKDTTDTVELTIIQPSRDGPSAGPVDVSGLTKMAASDAGLLPQPEAPKAKTALVQIYVRTQEFGGADKSSNGHRYDSIPFANGMINNGMSCQLIHYVHQEHDQFFEVCGRFDAIILRCNPGQIRADGGDQGKFDDAMRQLRKNGLQVWPSPDVMEQMGAKDALVKVANLHIGLEDTAAYYTEADFSEGFRKTMAFQPRVIKQNRGSAGEGIWIIKLQSGEYCGTYGDRLCADDEVLTLAEANDNHEETHTVAEFIEFCVKGRTDKSGTWTSKGEGKYLEGGKAAGGQLVDQRFCPRIVEGELRYNMIGETCVGIIHKKPKEGGISAVAGTGSVYTFYGPEEPKFAQLTANFLERDLPKVMPALDLPSEPIPLWWTADFILASPAGTPSAEERWIVGEFNCSCVGISKCLAAYCQPEKPTACYSDIPPEDRAEAMRLGDMMGRKAAGILGVADAKVVS